MNFFVGSSGSASSTSCRKKNASYRLRLKLISVTAVLLSPLYYSAEIMHQLSTILINAHPANACPLATPVVVVRYGHYGIIVTTQLTN